MFLIAFCHFVHIELQKLIFLLHFLFYRDVQKAVQYVFLL